MTSYAVSGNVREQLGAEGATEISAAQADAISTVAENIDAVVLVADSLAVPGFSDLASVVAACVAAQTAAQNAALVAGQAASDASLAAQGVGDSAAASEAWARQMETPVEGGDVSSKQSALNASGSATSADDSADTATSSAAAAVAAEQLVERYSNDPPGTEIVPGKFSIPTYVSQMQAMLAGAPVLAGRYISTPGVAGVETINLAATDFFHTIEINRAAGHDVKFKCAQGLFTGPPPGGLARSYAWIHLIRRGAGAVTVEGPADPGGGTVTTVFRPARIARGVADRSNNTPGTSAATAGTLAALAVPDGVGRRVVIIAHGIWWDQAPAANPAHTITVTSTNITGLTQLQSVGNGTNTDTSPVMTRLFSGTIDDTRTGLTDLGIGYSFSGFLARGHVEVYVFQNCSAIEHDTAQATAGSPTSVVKTLACTDANSVNLIGFCFKKFASAPATVAASPATADPDDMTWQGTSPGTTANDLAFATMQDAGLTAVTYTYTGAVAAGAGGSSATVAGLVLRPRTVTTVVPGDDGLITDSVRPFAIAAQGGHAMVLAASDGTSWYADQ